MRLRGPGFRAVDGDLDEPDRVRVLPQPTPWLTGDEVQPGDPCLIPIAVQHAHTFDSTVGGGGEMLREAGALGQVIVIDAALVGLDIGTCRGCCSAIHFYATMHYQSRPTIGPRNGLWAARKGRPSYVIRSMRAEGLEGGEEFRCGV